MDNFNPPAQTLAWTESERKLQAPLASAEGDLDVAVGVIELANLDVTRSHARSEVLQFCQDHPDALHRSCLEGHLTGSAFVVDPGSRSVLLIHHRKLNRWLQPGGHADGQGNLALVALTEVQEETGLTDVTVLLPAFDIDIHPIPARPGEPAHVHLDVRFVVVADRSQNLALATDEVVDGRWFQADDAELAANGDVNVVAARAFDIVDQLNLSGG